VLPDKAMPAYLYDHPAVKAVLSKKFPAKNINEYIEYLKNKTQLDDTEFYKYLRVKGLA